MNQRYASTRRMVHRCAPACAQRVGMTLVEMLVAMALSLIIILAVTQVFRIVGDNVMASRAVTEMSGQMRTVADRLRRDLDGLTVPALPWADEMSGTGYLEIVEGPFWDLGLGAVAAVAPPNPPADPLNPRPIPWFSGTDVGDFDDVLLFTCRSEGTPFVGQVLGTVTVVPDALNPAYPRLVLNYVPGSTIRTTIESNMAEIAWFTRFNDWNGDSQPDPGEVTLHRRVFLVLPQLDLSDSDIQALTPGQFYSGFDVSIRYQETSPGSGTWVKFANSLETLTLRENRIGHQVAGGFPVAPGAFANQSFPYRLSRALLTPQGTVMTVGPDGAWGVSGVDDDGSGVADDLGEAGQFGTDDLAQPIESVFATPWAITLGESFGNDVVLSQLLAFDVRVFDPTVTVQQALALSPQGAAATAQSVLPGDPGYQLAGTAVGQGGYVDLFYARYVPGALSASPIPPSISSTFAGLPLARSGLRQLPPSSPIYWGNTFPAAHGAVYDTWAMFYEHDGVDQDGNGIIDQGTNGFDDDNASGVDDAGERETSPPYPAPLRGIQVRLRIIDPDSRQVRQVTVSSDFVPE